MFYLVGVLMASGDALSQFIVERKTLLQYDVYRTSRFFLFGTFILVCVFLLKKLLVPIIVYYCKIFIINE